MNKTKQCAFSYKLPSIEFLQYRMMMSCFKYFCEAVKAAGRKELELTVGPDKIKLESDMSFEERLQKFASGITGD